jgi:hypothetical protein
VTEPLTCQQLGVGRRKMESAPGSTAESGTQS